MRVLIAGALIAVACTPPADSAKAAPPRSARTSADLPVTASAVIRKYGNPNDDRQTDGAKGTFRTLTYSRAGVSLFFEQDLHGVDDKRPVDQIEWRHVTSYDLKTKKPISPAEAASRLAYLE